MWDYYIISIIATALFFFYLNGIKIKWNWKQMSLKQKSLKLLLSAFFILSITIVSYGSYIAPQLIKVNETKINLNKTQPTEQIIIVQLSDLHAGAYKGETFFKRVADKVRELEPDLIVLTGDYIYQEEKDAEKLRPLEEVTKIFPAYAITGNHEYHAGHKSDYYQGKIKDKTGLLKKIFPEMGIILLENQGKLIQTRSGILYLAGINDLWSQPDDTNKLLRDISGKVAESLPKILLAHNPDVILEEHASGYDLILSGHTHGGQILLPGIGSIAGIPNELGRKFISGLYSLETGNQLFITKGLGESGPRARLFCRPEISVLTVDL